MKIFTSRYANRALADFDARKCGISRGRPRFELPYCLEGQIYDLAPSREAFTCNDIVKFKSLYFRQLECLGYPRVLSLIEQYASGKNIVLLCFEDVRKPADWCHRTMLAEWLVKRGTSVMELEAPALPDRKEEPREGQIRPPAGIQLGLDIYKL